MNHRGYLYAHQDGEYSFTAPIADNLSLLWLGPNAYSGYTRANANLEVAYTPVGSAPLEYKVTLVKGKYYPIRFSWDNSGGAGYYELKIKAPDGHLLSMAQRPQALIWSSLGAGMRMARGSMRRGGRRTRGVGISS